LPWPLAKLAWLPANRPPPKAIRPASSATCRSCWNARDFERVPIYTVLVEGDDLDDPIADTARSILDGHIVLDRKLANRRHYPSIDVLQSVSRLTEQLLDTEQKLAVSRFVQVLSRYADSEDMINIGAYVRGTNSETDYAIAMIDRLNLYLQQPVEQCCSIDEARQELLELVPSA
jgi:flagellum-specific ATP synthase